MTQKTRADLHLELIRETDKLQRLCHPRIVVSNTHQAVTVAIDAWCDGAEAEADKVMQVTRRYTALNRQLGGYDHGA